MSVTAFGSTVEEVQRKLNEILPLMDTGAARAKELHQQMEGELTQYQSAFAELDQSIDAMQETADAMDGEVDAAQSELETGVNELGVELADVQHKTEEALERIVQTGEQAELRINEATSELDNSSSNTTTQLERMEQRAAEMITMVVSLRENTESGFGELSEEVSNFTTQWEADSATSKGSLDTLTATVAQSHKDEVAKQFDGLNDSTVEAVTNVVTLATDHESSLNEFFAAFDTDADNLIEEFKSKSKEIFVDLQDYTENEFGNLVEDALETLGKEVVEALAAEMIASVVTTQAGVATTGMLSPLIPELIIAKKITGAINAVL